jgi:CheY-like chemotaxis protein
MLKADAGMMEQVVMNLSVNARDAMPKGGNLTIAVQPVELGPEAARANAEAREGSFICLAVTDDGCGMDEATLQRIFEPFFTTKAVGKGTGLGLATVHGIAKQHHGWIEAQSAVGSGTTFRIYLPASLQNAPAKDLLVPGEIRGGTETILLVEDEATVRAAAAQALKRYGYQVIEAANGNEAMEKWEKREGPIHLLFSDVIMPEGITGLELAERLKQSHAALRVIVSSGYSPELAGRNTEFFHHTHTCFLQKPYPTRVLIETVRRCLDEQWAT